MPKILLITQSFPYFPGEQFLEDEVKYWAECKNAELTIAPLSARGVPREIPNSVQLDTSLARFRRTYLHYFKGLVSPFFWYECYDLLRRKKLSFTPVKEALKSSVRLQHIVAALQAQDKKYDIIYSYWNDVGAYAAALAKRAGKCDALVSRAHRFDLYEDQREGGNLPFKRQFLNDFNIFFVISYEARTYALSTFGDLNVSVSRLGVPVGEQRSSPSPDGILRILSVSFCVPVKRIDRIMDGVVEFSRQHPEIQVEWVHFGDGPLRVPLFERSRKMLSEANNLQISFTGQLPNNEIRRRMAEQSWDVLINASESEGVPVSIMEAMSFGIPAIATNVGGVAELVDQHSGVLMGADVNGQEIANVLNSRLNEFKSDVFRSQCKNKVATEFNAELNYRDFVRTCLKGIG